jgi:hypothetical protein
MNNQEIALDIPDLLTNNLHLQGLDQVYTDTEDPIILVIPTHNQETHTESQHQSVGSLSMNVDN